MISCPSSAQPTNLAMTAIALSDAAGRAME